MPPSLPLHVLTYHCRFVGCPNLPLPLVLPSATPLGSGQYQPHQHLLRRSSLNFHLNAFSSAQAVGADLPLRCPPCRIGQYHSTKILSFAMRSPCCQHRIVVHTDPKNAEYVIAEGARRKAESYKAEDAGTVELASAEERHAKLADPLSRLEHETADAARGVAEAAAVSALRAESEARHRDDYALNKALRAQMRGARREEQAADARAAQLNLPSHVKLLPEAPGDALRAAAVTYGSQRFQQNWRKSRRAIAAEGIFSQGSAARGSSGCGPGRRRPADTKPGGASGGGARAGGAVLQKKRRLDSAVKLGVSEPGSKRQHV